MVRRLTIVLVFVLFQVVFGQIASNPITACPKLPARKPKDVNDLAPGDFKVVMALGDSITAGFGLMGQAGALDEFRGWSGFIGGNENNVTLPDFFRHYAPLVTGFSINEHFLELAGDKYHPEDRCNAAQSGATTTDLHSEVDHILQVLKNESTVDIENDWKFLNILIGANDACPLCKRGDKLSVQQAGDVYEQNLNDAITYVYDTLPKTLVNIIPLFNLSGVYYLGLNKTYCKDFHELFPWECPCAFDSTTENREYLDEVVSEYRNRVVAIAEQWQSQALPDFNVIYQPFTWDINIAGLPIDWISTLDCFHPSYIAHQMIAINTWNSLFLPLNQKPYNIDTTATITCPTATSRIWTN